MYANKEKQLLLENTTYFPRLGSCNYNTVPIILSGSTIMRKYKEKNMNYTPNVHFCALFCCISAKKALCLCQKVKMGDKICKLLSASILFRYKSLCTSLCNYDFQIDYIMQNALWEWAVISELFLV